jgi:hypothetical protein
MPRRSTVFELPPDIRAALDRRLVERGFQGYDELAQWLADTGHTVSRSAIHRYGQSFADTTERIRLSTQMAVTLGDAAGDDAGAMNDALIRLAQGELFELLLQADDAEAPLADRLPEITLAVSRLVRASLPQKKWQIEFREKAATAADEAVAIARKGGLSDASAEEIRRKVLGVAS